MIHLDEATLRKAASWQDFKEAQSLLNTGAVNESEKTETGWKGSVKVGSRIYRTTVIAKTPTWFDAKCPCPANQRQGTFCAHAIATGLHLINPPLTEKKTPPPQKSGKNTTPAIKWQIRFQGSWQKSFEKGRLSVALSPATDPDRPCQPSDSRLTTWLLSQKITAKPPIHLALDPDTLPGFLDLIEGHPEISTPDGPLTVETGIQLHLADCAISDGKIRLLPSGENLISFGNSFWKTGTGSLSKTGTIPSPLQQIFRDLADRKPTVLTLNFFLDHLDSLQSLLDFTSSEWFESLQFIPATPTFELILEGTASKISSTFNITYPGETLPRMTDNTVFTRNPKAEQTAKTYYQTVFCSSGSPIIQDSQAIETLLTKTLKSLPPEWKTTLSPSVRKLSESYVFISPKIGIIDSNDSSIQFDLTFESSDGTIVSNAEIRRLLRSKNSPSHLFHGKTVTLSDDIENLIDPIFEDLEIHQENGRYTANKASAFIIYEISKKILNSLSKNKLQNYPQDVPILEIPAIQADLRPYQTYGFSWLVDRLKHYQGALLADDMGLGKTIQTIACAEHLFTSHPQLAPALVVVTTSLLGNWEAEFSRFAPHRKIVTLHGSKRDKLREEVTADCVVLTTYSTLSRDLAYHLKQEYSLVVIDEASLIRNPDTDHSKAVARLNSTRRIALTGTPVENSARDLWAIFRFIQPGWLGTRKQFEEKYEQPLKSPETSARTSQLLRLKTLPFVLRRTKQEVAPELPSKIHIDEYCTLSNEQLATYRDLQKEGQKRIKEIRDSGQPAAARMQTLTTLLRLRQACCDLALFDSEKLKSLPIPRRSAKLERLLEITEQSVASGSRILVFSQFQKQLVEIENQLTSLGIGSLRLDGQTRNRQELVNRFQSPEGPPVFLISLKAGGYGLNLTAADVVVHFDPWWNPAAEAQATDRAHRIGQTKPVTVFRLLTRNTVEEKVTRLQSTKKALADSLDETATPTDAPAWTASELELLLRD